MKDISLAEPTTLSATRRLRIAMVGAKGIPALHGGIERHVDEIGTRLAARGHAVDVFTRPYHPYRLAFHNGVRLRRRPSLTTKHLDAATHTGWCVIESLLSRRYDLMHIHGIGPGLFVRLASLGVPTVFTYHAQDWRQRKWGRVARWSLLQGESTAVRHAAAVIVVSRLLQDYVRRKYGRESYYVPNGAVVPEAPGSDRIRALGLESGRYVLFVGRLIPDRGVDTLLEAFAGVEPPWRLAIVGEVHLDDATFEAYRRRANERVHFLGHQSGETLTQLYANAQVCVHPSRVEGLPIAVLEAMGHARTVVVSDIPENLEAIGDAGVRFPVGDAAALRQTLHDLLADPGRVASLGSQALARVQSDYDWEEITTATEKVYEDAVLAVSGSLRRRLSS